MTVRHLLTHTGDWWGDDASDTGNGDDAEINRHPHAIGHGRGPQGTAVVTPLYFPRNIDPAGGLWSMTRDLLRYARFHLGDDTVPVGGMPKKADERRFRRGGDRKNT